MGCSGTGAYHGKWSFDTFVHKKGTLFKDLSMEVIDNRYKILRYKIFIRKEGGRKRKGKRERQEGIRNQGIPKNKNSPSILQFINLII